MIDVAIIGGGFSGLLAGSLLSRKYRVVVFEKNSFVGGRAATRT
ncbi:FAD-dependent oxidoreductase, partial [Candidatus Geothermarchaeota archaeon]